jgi:hypothetical protein
VISLSESDEISSEATDIAENITADPAAPVHFPVQTTKTISAEPYHPDVSIIHPKRTKTQNINFQQKWFIDYPWLTYETSLSAVLCHDCNRAYSMGMMTLAKKKEEAFTVAGFSNWKKAKERFESHMRTDAHKHAVSVLKAQEQQSVIVRLNHEEEDKQKERRRCMIKVIRKIRILLRQGIAFRSNPETEGNLYQFLHDDAEEDPGLAAYLRQNTSYTSWIIQKEFCSAFSHAILRRLATVNYNIIFKHSPPLNISNSKFFNDAKIYDH